MADRNGFGKGYGRANPLIPYRSKSTRFHREGEGLEAMPELFAEGRTNTFDMSDKEDKADYERIMTLNASGEARIVVHEHKFDPETKNWIIFLVYYLYEFTERDEAQTKRLNISEKVRTE